MRKALVHISVFFLAFGGMMEASAQNLPYGTVVISEVMARPNPSLSSMPDSEYTELYNRSDQSLSLRDWTYSDLNRRVNLPDISIPAGGYVLLVPASRLDRWEAFSNIQIIGLSPWPTLNVSGDDLQLNGPSGELVFFLPYRDSWYKNSLKAQGGYSLEMIDKEAICMEAPNWQATESREGGTPGKVNSIQQTLADTEAPVLNRISVNDSLSLHIAFNERLETLSAFQAMYRFSPALGIESIELMQPQGRVIKVRLTTALQEGIYYRLDLQGIRDCNGNEAPVPSSGFFGLPSPVEKGDIVINELLSHPRPGGAKFVEIHNVSSKILDLRGWRLANLSNGEPANFRTISMEPLLLGPGGYMAFTDDPERLLKDYPSTISSNLFEVNLPSYPQSEGHVVLIDDRITLLDQFSYSEDFHHPLVRNPVGISLERISSEAATQSKSTWTSAAQSAGFATPGATNSQSRRFENIAQNFSIEPQSFAPDDTSGPNFCTIRYVFELPGHIATLRIFDSSGREVRTLAENEGLGTEGFFTWDGTTANGQKARLGYYILVAEVYDIQGNYQRFKETLVIATRF
jgi:hypothetical protein